MKDGYADEAGAGAGGGLSTSFGADLLVPVTPLPALALLPVLAVPAPLEGAGAGCLSAATAVALGKGRMTSFSGLKVGYDDADDAEEDEDEEDTPFCEVGCSGGLFDDETEGFDDPGTEPVVLIGSTTMTSVQALRSPSIPPGKSSIARIRNS